MIERLASDNLTRLIDVLKDYVEKGMGLPTYGMPSLLKLVINARELARETEEELRIVEHRLSAARDPIRNGKTRAVDLGPDGNVIRLPGRPRVVSTINPDGGAA